MFRPMTNDNQNTRHTVRPDWDPVEVGLMVLGVVVLVVVFLAQGLLFTPGPAAADNQNGLGSEPMPGASRLVEEPAEHNDRSDQMAEDAECPPPSPAHAWA